MRKKAAYSLIEVTCAMGVIGILSIIAFKGYHYMLVSKTAETYVQEFCMLRNALMRYKESFGVLTFPSGEFCFQEGTGGNKDQENNEVLNKLMPFLKPFNPCVSKIRNGYWCINIPEAESSNTGMENSETESKSKIADINNLSIFMKFKNVAEANANKAEKTPLSLEVLQLIKKKLSNTCRVDITNDSCLSYIFQSPEQGELADIEINITLQPRATIQKNLEINDPTKNFGDGDKKNYSDYWKDSTSPSESDSNKDENWDIDESDADNGLIAPPKHQEIDDSLLQNSSDDNLENQGREDQEDDGDEDEDMTENIEEAIEEIESDLDSIKNSSKNSQDAKEVVIQEYFNEDEMGIIENIQSVKAAKLGLTEKSVTDFQKSLDALMKNGYTLKDIEATLTKITTLEEELGKIENKKNNVKSFEGYLTMLKKILNTLKDLTPKENKQNQN